MLQIFTSSLRFLFIPLSFFVRFPRTLPLPSLALVLCFYLTFCSLFFPCRSSPSPFHISCRFSFRFFTLDIVLMFLTSVHVHIECIFMALKLYAEVLVFLLLLLFVLSLLRVFFLPFPSLKILDLFHLLLRLLNYSGFIHNLFICV